MARQISRGNSTSVHEFWSMSRIDAATEVLRSRVQKFPAWHTKAAPNGKCCEGYIVPSRVTGSRMWKVCWNKGRLRCKIAKLFYFCHLKKLVRPETFGPYHVQLLKMVVFDLVDEVRHITPHGKIQWSEVWWPMRPDMWRSSADPSARYRVIKMIRPLVFGNEPVT